MARKAYSLGLTGKAQTTLFLAIFVFLMLISLSFSPAGATTIDWQAQGPSPFNQGQATIIPDNPLVGAIQSLLVWLGSHT